MSDTEKMSDAGQTPSKQSLLLGLIIVLVIIMAIQAWYMVGMKKQLNGISMQRLSVAHQVFQAPVNAAAVMAMNTHSAQKSSLTKSKAVTGKHQQVKPKSVKPKQPAPVFNNGFSTTPFNAQNWNPYEEIQQMQRNMNRMFNRTFTHFNQSPDFRQFFSSSVTVPKMDVKENKKQYTIIVNVPGADAKNMSVNLNGQRLTVKGEQNSSEQNKNSNGNVVFQERSSGSFQRTIALPSPVKKSGMKTQISNGVLTITIPKA